MRRAVAVLALFLSACGVAQARVRTPAPPDTDGVLRLVGRFNAAHACPISEDLALTNAHVTDVFPDDRAMPGFPLLWSDALGHDGMLEPLRIEDARDLAVMTSDRQFVRWYKVATTAPEPGERLWTIGYERRKGREMYARRDFAVSVLRIVARKLKDN